MRFQSRSFWIAKDVESPEYYEDAFCLDGERGIAAIADGVSSAIFSGPWAQILTRATVEQPPQLEDGALFSEWLGKQRADWLAQIDTSRLTWYQRPKMVDGAMSTLLWFTLDPASDGKDGISPAYCLQSFAIGDCCLFHTRQGKHLRSFPIEAASDFDLTPAVIGSFDRKQDHLMEFKVIQEECHSGDLLVLCTDAIAQWAIGLSEANSCIDWEKYWDMPTETWQAEIVSLRRERAMRYDDSTLLLLRVLDDGEESTSTTRVTSAAVGAAEDSAASTEPAKLEYCADHSTELEKDGQPSAGQEEPALTEMTDFASSSPATSLTSTDLVVIPERQDMAETSESDRNLE